MHFIGTFTACFAGLLLVGTTLAATVHTSSSTFPDDYFLLNSFPASGHANNMIQLGSELRARGYSVVMAINADEQNIKSRILNADIDYYDLGDKPYSRFLFENKDEVDGKNPIRLIKFMSKVMHKFNLGLYKDIQIIIQSKPPRAFIYPEVFLYGGHLAHKYNIPGVLIAPHADPTLLPLLDTCPLNTPFFIRSLDPGFFERVLNVLVRVGVPFLASFYTDPLMIAGCAEIGVSNDVCFPFTKHIPRYGQLAIAPTGYPISVCNIPHYYKRVGPFVQPNMFGVAPEVEDWFQQREMEDADVIYLSTGSDMILSQLQAEELLDGIDMVRQKRRRPLYVYYARGQDVLDRGLKQEDHSFVYWAKYSPQHWILNHTVTKLFISHCGAGGSNDACYFGVPVYGLPLGRDQPMLASSLAAADMAIVGDVNNINAEKVAEQIQALLEDETFSKNALRISRINQNSGGVVEAADLVERYLAIGSNDYNVPFDHDWPWWKRTSLDVFMFMFVALFGSVASLVKFAVSGSAVGGSTAKVHAE